MSPSEQAYIQTQLPMGLSTHFPPDQVRDETDNTATSISGGVIPMGPANTGEMWEAEASTDVSAPLTPEAHQRDLDTSPSPSTMRASPRELATKQAIFTLIQDHYTLATIEDAGTLSSIPFTCFGSSILGSFHTSSNQRDSDFFEQWITWTLGTWPRIFLTDTVCGLVIYVDLDLAFLTRLVLELCAIYYVLYCTFNPFYFRLHIVWTHLKRVSNQSALFTLYNPQNEGINSFFMPTLWVYDSYIFIWEVNFNFRLLEILWCRTSCLVMVITNHMVVSNTLVVIGQEIGILK